jgi:hypothetical protein
MPVRSITVENFFHLFSSECIARGRSCVLKCAAELVLTTLMLLETTDRICSTYHDFVRKQGDQFETPDLCIAFNSGATQGHVGYTWQTSIKFLVEHKIPSLFTVRSDNQLSFSLSQPQRIL